MRRARTNSAFTLNELLIVIAIIVLLMAIAVPTFNLLSGSSSIAGATNQVSAMLGQARSQAIGVQEIRGVMFFLDPATDRENMAIVRDSGYDNGDGVTYLDLVPDMDFIPLPSGVGAQTIGGAAATGTSRSTESSDGYIGYNNTNSASLTIQTFYGGAILFDSSGKLVNTRYGFCCSQQMDPTKQPGPMTAMASLLVKGDVSAISTGSTNDFAVPAALSSQIGVALYDRQAFNNIPTLTHSLEKNDHVIAGAAFPYDSNQKGEEAWLDGDATLAAGGANVANNAGATLLLINRYNGTLIKTE